MLTAITLDNFKSYRNATLPLSSLTILMGANASGKSNAIEGIRLLSWLAQKQKLASTAYAVQSNDRMIRGKVEDLVYANGRTFSLGCETEGTEWHRLRMKIELRDDGLHIIEEEMTRSNSVVPLYSLDHPSTDRSTDVGVAYDNFARGGKKPHLTCSDQMAIFTQLTSPATFDASHKISRQTIPQVTKKYERWLTAILFIDPAPARMRGYSFPSDKVLQGDGSNLSAVLYNLWGTDADTEAGRFKEQRDEILNFIKSLPEQDIADISFLHEPRGGVMLKLTETFGNHRREYDASVLSDGTLRVLSIAAAMLSTEEGSLVIIEEIDNGVHPSRACHLMESIRKISERRQLRVLFSTHNPALLDALPDEALPDVVFCYRDPDDGSSRLVKLENVPEYPELVAQGSLGQLVTTGTLERFVKQPGTGKDRQVKAKEWLENIRQGIGR
jgi:predicted ATPase